MYKLVWREITARGRIVRKHMAFKSESDRETYIDQLVQKLGFREIVSIRDPLWSRD